jgi:L-ascorbate metabolism protein UlaG (beta-lactamase superfamily)
LGRLIVFKKGFTMRITMIGHSTILIETGGQKVLTDPYFGTWGNPAYARLKPPAQAREAFYDVDLVLLSHNHWDHVDRPFLRALSTAVPVVAPPQTTWLTRWQGAGNVLGLRAWQSQLFGKIRITAVPALHVTITTGFVIESEDQPIYFAGDTYQHPFMKEIGRRFRLEVALMPVTTYRLPMTMGESAAVRAVQDLSPQVVIPIHLGLRPRFPLLRTAQSPAGFERRLRQAQSPVKVVTLREGEAWSP